MRNSLLRLVRSFAPTIHFRGSLTHHPNPILTCHVHAQATLERTYLLPSRLMSPHTRYYVREMRILAYGQLLESYRSLTLESLSAAFGVSVEFVDKYVLYACALSSCLMYLLVNSHDLSQTDVYIAPSTRYTVSWRPHGHHSRTPNMRKL